MKREFKKIALLAIVTGLITILGNRQIYIFYPELIPQMDYDSVEMILKSISEYSLPDKDAGFFEELGKLLKLFDWDGMEALIAKAK